MSESLERKDIAEFRKYKDCINYSGAEICVWHVEYRFHDDNDWYDLFEDPPEWALDVVIDALSKYE